MKTYIFIHFYQQYLVLLTMVPGNRRCILNLRGIFFYTPWSFTNSTNMTVHISYVPKGIYSFFFLIKKKKVAQFSNPPHFPGFSPKYVPVKVKKYIYISPPFEFHKLWQNASVVCWYTSPNSPKIGGSGKKHSDKYGSRHRTRVCFIFRSKVWLTDALDFRVPVHQLVIGDRRHARYY